MPAVSVLDGIEEHIWRSIAYVARYGHQQVSEMMLLDMPDFMRLRKEVERIVIDENKPRGEDD